MRTTGGRTEPIGRFAVSVPLLAAFFVLATAVPADGYRILAVETVAGKSHWNFMSAVLRALTDAGHEVTAFTPFPDGDRENYTEVDVGGLRPSSDLDVTYLIENFGSTSTVMANMANATRSFCAAVFKHRRMTEILQRRPRGRPQPRFDAVITEPFVSECVSYAAAELRVPLIYVIPPPIPTYLERSLFGHVPNPAVVTHVLSRGGVLQTFGRRFANVALTVYCSVLTWQAEQRLRDADPQPFDLVDPVKPAITFINTHFITEPSRPLPPNVVQIGGIHLARPKSIPEVSRRGI